MKQYKALIIGAGKIGAFFDEPKSKTVLTHAHAYRKHPGFDLVGFVDNNTDQAEKAAKIWGGKSYGSIDAAFNQEKDIDVVSVCVPDDYHYEIIKKLTDKPIKFILAEKPITKNLAEAEEIIKLCQKKKIGLQVNYSRRFVPEFIQLQKEIKSGLYGEFKTGSGYYGKGILHNGSHLIDLIRQFIGDICSIIPISQELDFNDDDPSVSAVLKMKNGGTLALLHFGHQHYTIFELDLFFSQARVSLRDSGNYIKIYQAKNSPDLAGYKFLSKDKEMKTSTNQAIYFAIQNIYEHLKNGAKLACNGQDAYLNLKNALTIKTAK